MAADLKKTGKEGELEIVKNVACPNCQKKLMRLPTNYPLFDVQCKCPIPVI